MATVPESHPTTSRQTRHMETPLSRADVIVPIALVIATIIMAILVLVSEVYILHHG